MGGLAIVALVFACEPTPNFPTPEQPVPGMIWEERSAIATGADQQIGLLYKQYLDSGQHRIRVSIPAGAYPVGTRVTIRLVFDLGTLADIGDVMGQLAGLSGASMALQILPAGLVPARPLRIEISNVWPKTSNFDLLHAYEGDHTWTTVAKVDIGATTVAFEVGQPGLWTLADPTVDGGAAYADHD